MKIIFVNSLSGLISREMIKNRHGGVGGLKGVWLGVAKGCGPDRATIKATDKSNMAIYVVPGS